MTKFSGKKTTTAVYQYYTDSKISHLTLNILNKSVADDIHFFFIIIILFFQKKSFHHKTNSNWRKNATRAPPSEALYAHGK